MMIEDTGDEKRINSSKTMLQKRYHTSDHRFITVMDLDRIGYQKQV